MRMRRSNGMVLAVALLSAVASSGWAFTVPPMSGTFPARRASPCRAAAASCPLLPDLLGSSRIPREGSSRLHPATLSLRMKEPESFDVSADDGHSIKVWAKGPENGRVVVLMHGRTWSARPVWDLQVGSPPRDGASELGASTMDLMASHGLRTYAPDLRGLGGTGRDEPGFTTPKRCAADLRDVMKFVRSRHPDVSPLLVGWSQGAAVAQLYAQDNIHDISGLVLYGSIYDPAPTPVAEMPEVPPKVMNTMEGAMEDWTVPGQIDDEAAAAFGTEALKWDPRKVSWANVHEFDVLDPSRITVPTLVIHGEKDFYTDMEKQRSLFMGLSTPDKAWQVVGNADHPVHLYPKQRKTWMRAVLALMDDIGL